MLVGFFIGLVSFFDICHSGDIVFFRVGLIGEQFLGTQGSTQLLLCFWFLLSLLL